MKFLCTRPDLIHGVQTVINAVSNRNTLPILANILFEAEKDKITLSATDLEVSIRCQMAAEISAPGNITIPAKRLLEIVRELPDKDISVSVSDNALITLVCEKSIFKLNGLTKDDYPILPKIKTDKGFNFSKKSLQNMIKKTIFSVSTDETRYVLNGVLFLTENNNLLLVSTDGHRLALIEQVLEKGPAQNISQIIPAKALQELSKILDDEGEVNIQLNENQIIFSTSKVILMSHLIDGQFPNYTQVIPKQSEKLVRCQTEKILLATRRVALMASDKSNSVKYSISKNKLVITAMTPEVGEAQEEIEIDYSGDNLMIAFNAKYVVDVLKNLDSEECVLELTSSLNPGVFKPSPSVENYMCVIMPMRF